MTISSKTLLHISGAAALLTASYAMAQTAGPNGRPAPLAPDLTNALGSINMLEKDLNATKKELAAVKNDLASLKNEQKTLATMSWENKGELSNLRKAYNKHTHWQDFAWNDGNNQKILSAVTSPATEFCGPNPQKFGESKKWNNLYACQPPK